MINKGKSLGKTVARNRKARYNYKILETVEAGIMLKGTEVKSLREGKASINESFASDQNGELFLLNAHIPEYSHGTFTHDPRAARKLLLHSREILKFVVAIQRKGLTIVPLSIYFNNRGRAKVELGCAIGKQQHDKREASKQRDWSRQKARLIRESN
jgi:SsrA-binding protein